MRITICIVDEKQSDSENSASALMCLLCMFV